MWTRMIVITATVLVAVAIGLAPATQEPQQVEERQLVPQQATTPVPGTPKTSIKTKTDVQPLITPEQEIKACWDYIYSKEVKTDQVNYLRFFTTYNIPLSTTLNGRELPHLREDAEHALQYVLNATTSISADSIIAKAKRLPGSNTIWFIDIRDFGWTEEQMDAIFALQPYFLNPLVEQPGSILFRADWWIVNTTDTTWQDDRGLKDLAYYILQYGKGNEPKDANEFRKFWQVDINTVRDKQVEQGTVVDAGDSGVSRHTRQLRFSRTIYGDYAETRDVKSHDLDPDRLQSRDYLEDIFANHADAGEYIASNKRGLMTCLLSAGNKDNFKRLEFGDPTVVVDRQDAEDPRVRTAKGCFICHAIGYIPTTNAIRELYESGGDLRAKSREIARAIKVFYMQNLTSIITEHNNLFALKVKECNGLDPMDNMHAYLNIYDWYRQKIGAEQAAVECGQPTALYKTTIAGATTGRLVNLFRGKTIPRDIWDSLNSGGYIQSMFLQKRLEFKDLRPQRKQEVQQQRAAPSTTMSIATATYLYPHPSPSNNTANLPVLVYGAEVTLLQDVNKDIVRVRTPSGQEGYVYKPYLQAKSTP